MATLKGFKVTDADRRVRVGVAAKGLDDLKAKVIEKFKLKLTAEEMGFQTADGTIVENDEYFQTLDAQTLLVWVRGGERAETDAEILYKTIREVNDEYLTAGAKVQEFFTEKMKSKVFKLAEVLKGIDATKVVASTRDAHPEWFEGLDTRSKTKEEYMFRRAQDRLRTFYYKTREELLRGAESGAASPRLTPLLADLQRQLQAVNYYGCYFDRSRSTAKAHARSLCDAHGTFTCQGRWDKANCLYQALHTINPYASREERLVFQMWNLDHGVERSRGIIPAIRHALIEVDERKNGRRRRQIDAEKIFDDLFTTKNLKLVHIVCHDKAAHASKTAGPYVV